MEAQALEDDVLARRELIFTLSCTRWWLDARDAWRGGAEAVDHEALVHKAESHHPWE
jgi:hypothetical protein